MENFHFLRPWWFLALVPVVLILVWYWKAGARKAAGEWSKIVDEALLPALLSSKVTRRGRRSAVLAGLSGVLVITALAGPVWKRLAQPLYDDRGAMVLILDLSRSMLATDLKPNRLLRARLKLIDLLRERKSGETGLVVFAGDAFTVSPLTDDVKTILSLEQDLSVNLMPVQGSRLSTAIAHSVELMRQAGHKRGALVAITDGGDAEALVAAAAASKAGYRLSIMGVGTAEGAPASLPGDGFITGSSGQVVIHKLDKSFLMQVASMGGGVYVSASSGPGDVASIMKISRDMLNRSDAMQKKQLRRDQWREEGPWLLLLLAPLVALAFRRGYLLLLVFLVPLPQTVQAADMGKWFRNSDQNAHELLQQGDAAAAAGQFRSPDWKASALYKSGRYDESLKLWQTEDTPESWYNRGNALAQSGKLKKALTAYDIAIKRDAGNTDAAINRDLVRKLLEQKQQQNKDQQKSPRNNQDKQNKQQQKSSQDKKEKQNEQDEQQQKSQDSSSGESKQQNKNGDSSEQSGQKSPQKQSNESEQTENKGGSDADQQGDQREQNQAATDAESKDKKNSSKIQRKPDTMRGDAATRPEQNPEQQADTAAEAKQNAAKNQLRADLENIKNAPDDQQTSLKPSSRRLLRAIPDDPGGLMRRKFLYQYRQRGQSNPPAGESW